MSTRSSRRSASSRNTLTSAGSRTSKGSRRSTGTRNGATLDGVLLKEGGSRKSWKERYFLLQGKRLLYFANKGDAKPKGEIDLLTFTVGPSKRTDMLRRGYVFEVVTPKRTYYLCAASKQDMERWVDRLDECRRKPEIEGYLHVDLASGHKWKRQYARLFGTTLTLYADEKDLKPAHTWDLTTCTVSMSRSDERPHMFEITNPKLKSSLAADSRGDLRSWLSTLPGQSITYQGELIKQGAVRKNWKKRYFVLVGYTLLYFTKKGDRQPLGEIALEEAEVRRAQNPSKSKYTFEIHTPNRIYVMYAANAEEMDKWLQALPRPVPPRYQSWLMKEGFVVKNMKKRFFILRGDKLKYFVNSGDKDPKGVIELAHAWVRDAAHRDKDKFGFEIVTPSRTYYLVADSEETRQKWKLALPQRAPPELTGTLHVFNKLSNKWVKRYAVVLDGSIFTYDKQGDPTHRGALLVEGGEIEQSTATGTRLSVISVTVGGRTILFGAENDASAKGWITAMQATRRCRDSVVGSTKVHVMPELAGSKARLRPSSRAITFSLDAPVIIEDNPLKAKGAAPRPPTAGSSNAPPVGHPSSAARMVKTTSLGKIEPITTAEPVAQDGADETDDDFDDYSSFESDGDGDDM